MTRLLLVVAVLAGCDAAAPAAPAAGPNAIEIVVRTQPTGGRVLVDGAPAGDAPATVKLNPGPHRIKAVMSGYYPSTETKIQVGSTEPREHVLTLIASH
jgi:hypothetical protein